MTEFPFLHENNQSLSSKFITRVFNCISWLLFCILLLPRINGNGQRHTDSEAGGVCECVGGP